MNPNTRRRWIRIGASVLALGLLTAAPCPSVRAQDGTGLPEEGESGGKGRPLDGYFGTAILAFGALFLIGKSARR
jgi:hypothetical protein